MVAGVAVPVGAGAAVAGAGGGGRVRAEGEVDMGRRWRAWRRLGERDWWWRGLGVVDAYRWQGEQGAWWDLWGKGEVDVGQRWRPWRRRGQRERWLRGLGDEVAYGRRGERELRWGPWGEGEVDMGRHWRAWWRPGEGERRERGPGGLCWCLGERERREWVVEARWRCGECGRRGRVCRAGGSRSAAVCETRPHRSSRASQEVSAGPGGPRVVPPGTGGGGRSPVVHGSAT